LVADIQSWLDYPATNFGWLLKTPEAASDAKRFASREHLVASERPRLVITFIPPASVATIGSGCSNALGTPLSFAATGLPVIGNAAFLLALNGAQPGAQGFVFVAQGLEPNPIAVGSGCFVYLNLSSVSQFITLGLSPIGPLAFDQSGLATLPAPVPPDLGLLGLRFDVQGLAFDATASLGFTLSNALSLTLGY
jgi:hypothetical protein